MQAFLASQNVDFLIVIVAVKVCLPEHSLVFPVVMARLGRFFVCAFSVVSVS